MSISTPLTASSAILYASRASNNYNATDKPLEPNLGHFEKDIVEISKLGIEKQQTEAHLEATKEIEDVASEVIKISSTIGKAESVGYLTNSQATALYNKISSLL